jgi:DNA polymerase alpha subunit A
VNADGPTPNPSVGYKTFSLVRPLSEVNYPVGFRDILKNLSKNPSRYDISLSTPFQHLSTHRVYHVCQNEKSLLALLLAKIEEYDPDVLVGHNFIGFDLDVLLHRLDFLQVAVSLFLAVALTTTRLLVSRCRNGRDLAV